MKTLDFIPTAGTCYNSGLYARLNQRHDLCRQECPFVDFVKCPANGWDEKKIKEYYELMKEKG